MSERKLNIRSTVYPNKPYSHDVWMKRFRVGTYSKEYARQRILENPKKHPIVETHVCDMSKLIPILKRMLNIKMEQEELQTA